MELQQRTLSDRDDTPTVEDVSPKLEKKTLQGQNKFKYIYRARMGFASIRYFQFLFRAALSESRVRFQRFCTQSIAIGYLGGSWQKRSKKRKDCGHQYVQASALACIESYDH